MQVEYDMITNHLRMIDQIIDKDPTESLKFLDTLERLGTDSLRHATKVANLIERIGGEPDFEAIVLDKTLDIKSMLVEQLGKEKSVMSIYQDAKHIAQTNQVKTQGFFGKLLSFREESRNEMSRNRVIEILTGLQNDEWGHIKRIENAMLELKIENKAE